MNSLVHGITEPATCFSGLDIFEASGIGFLVGPSSTEARVRSRSLTLQRLLSTNELRNVEPLTFGEIDHEEKHMEIKSYMYKISTDTNTGNWRK